MNRSSSHRPSTALPILAILSATALLTGCATSSAPDEQAPSFRPEAAATRADESARVQAFLEGIYSPRDVVHAFRSAAGQDIDCVDFAAEPGVKAQLAEGLSLDDIRAGASLTPEQLEWNKTARKLPRAFAGDPDERGRPRQCPDGSVPHVRITPERIAAAGGLDAYVARMTTKTPPPGITPYGCPYANVDGYQWLVGGWAPSQGSGVGNQGGFVTMAVAQPRVVMASDHSLAQTWTSATSACQTQTVETGWAVDPGINGDSKPHVFIYATASTYGASPGAGSGCWNNVGGASCVSWVQYASDYPPGKLIDGVSWPGQPQQEFTFSTQHVRARYCRFGSNCYLGWQIAYRAYDGPWEVMGYYANSAYGTGPLASAADTFQIGTEVDSFFAQSPGQPPEVTMGEGPTIAPPTPTFQPQYYGTYAYFHDFFTYSPAATLGPAPVQNYVGVGQSSQLCAPGTGCLYLSPGVDVGDPDPGTPWTNWWYYGDAY